MNRREALDQLRDIACKLHHINKQMETSVSGLSLTREDLGIRRPKKERRTMAHGQKHSQPTTGNGITTPTGIDVHSDSAYVAPFYQ